MSTTIEQIPDMNLANVHYSAESSWSNLTSEDIIEEIKEFPRPKRYYYRLESESSKASEDDLESIYSIQGKETDFVKDTSDTETYSTEKDEEYEVEVEYEVASLSECPSDSESVVLAAAATVMYSDTVDQWVTDAEDSESSSDQIFLDRKSFITCLKCKGTNLNPVFKYCGKCYQDRKSFYPPRPKRNLRKRVNGPKVPSVKLDTLRNYLSGLSEISQITPEECPQLGLDQIVVPEYLKLSSTSSLEPLPSTSTGEPTLQIQPLKRKRRSSESSVSDFEVKKPKLFFDCLNSDSSLKSSSGSFSSATPSTSSETSGFCSSGSYASIEPEKMASSEDSNVNKDLCLFCNKAPKDGVFVHGKLAHCCYCYLCAKKTAQTSKRCPMCNRSVFRVIKMYIA